MRGRKRGYHPRVGGTSLGLMLVLLQEGLLAALLPVLKYSWQVGEQVLFEYYVLSNACALLEKVLATSFNILTSIGWFTEKEEVLSWLLIYVNFSRVSLSELYYFNWWGWN